MKFILSILFFIFFLIKYSYAQQVTFEKYYDTLGCYYGNCVQQTFDGGYVLCGSNYTTANAQDAAIIKTDSLGNIEWVKLYGGPNTDGALYIEQTPDSGYIVAGIKDDISLNDCKIWLLKTANNGDTIWSKEIKAGNGRNYANCVRQTNDGGFAITGYTSARGAGSYDVYLVKTNSMGDTLWTKTFGGAFADVGNSVQQTYDSGYIITGNTGSFGAGGSDVYLIKTNSVGDTLWTKTFGGANADAGFAVQQTGDSGFVIAGYTTNIQSHEDLYLIRINSFGDTLWTKCIGDTTENTAQNFQITTDSGLVIVGTTHATGSGNFYDVYLVKTNAYGDTLWTRTFGGSMPDHGYFVRQTHDGGFIIVGTTASFTPPPGADIYLIKTDSIGSLIIGIDELIINLLEDVFISPNPFNNSAIVMSPFGNSNSENIYYEITDVFGRKMFSEIIQGNKIIFTIQRNNMSDGIYFIKIFSRNAVIVISKFIIQ
ncbi:MAG: T9SS type A sorting domain-containing protein [Bacteroidetes bacterium]|nr:T9SS type A sorting domain-containing protein [Bacteroidota bacterium]